MGQGPGQGRATSISIRRVLQDWCWYQPLPGGFSRWLSLLNSFLSGHDAKKELVTDTCSWHKDEPGHALIGLV